MSRKLWIPLTVALAVLAVVWTKPWAFGRPPARSALIITLDTTRADALECYRKLAERGICADASPRLDALARESVLYETARTTAPITLPSHASMMTGLYPPRHAARDNSNVLPEAARTLAESARAGGLETAAFIAAAVLDRAAGLAQGFEVYDTVRRQAGDDSVHYAERPATAVIQRFEAWFERRSEERPFLAWVHFFDPHAPYLNHPEFSAPGRKPYCTEIAAIDAAVGRLLDLLESAGLADETLVIVVGDHGESFGQHGEDTHTVLCYEATMRVPFLVRHPDGHRAGETSSEIVSVADVHPTVLSALGLEAPADLDGVDLWSGTVPPERGVYFESFYAHTYFGFSPIAGWADRNGKYLHGREPEFYPAGSGERKLRIADLSATAAYRTAIESVHARPVLKAERTDDAERANSLASLGYATASPGATDLPHPLTPLELPDARTRMSEVDRTLEAISQGEGGRRERAITELRAIVEQNPDNFEAGKYLAIFLVFEERWAEAVPFLERTVERSETPSDMNNLAWCLQELGRTDEAVQRYERALELAPTDVRILGNYAALLTELGREKKAAELQQRAREVRRVERERD